MADISSLAQWWDDWQLRVLVLGSLGLQWFLLLAAPMRKYAVPRAFRTCIWLAYISSDALAIYALATLFDRHARTAPAGICPAPAPGAGPGKELSRILEVLWAPILLIHLGGQEELTAYKIEESEQWARPAMTLVSKVAVALYAFYKSWPWQPSSSDWRLTAAAGLLFVVGVLSFSEKPIALNRAKSAKTKRLAAVSAWKTKGAKTKPSVRRQDMTQFSLSEDRNCFGSLQSLSASFHASGSSSSRRQNKEVALSPGDKVVILLSDMSLRTAAKELVEQRRAERVEDLFPPLLLAEKLMALWLRGAFDFVYTRASVVASPVYLIYHLALVPVMHIAVLALFATSDKHWYKRADVKITYIVLSLTAAQDFLAVFIRQLVYLLMSTTQVPAVCETVPGYNLIDEAVGEADKGITGCAGSVCRPRHRDLYKKVSAVVLPDLMQGAQDRDLASYRIFDSPAASCRRAGLHRCKLQPGTTTKNWALSDELQASCGEETKSSLSISFDRSVLLWHIATDLCFRCSDVVDDGHEEDVQDGEGEAAEELEEGEELQGEREELQDQRGGGEETKSEDGGAPHGNDAVLRLKVECTEAISNYMARLLNSNPEMLLTGSRQHLISEARDELKSFFLSNNGTSSHGCSQMNRGGGVADLLSRKHLLKELIYRIADGREANPGITEGFFHTKKACKLAKELLEIPDDSTRWKLMYQVWLGILCYSAGMCRAYLHAKRLGEGGEFLSFVWLVLSLKGAKTLADKLQMPPETEASVSTPAVQQHDNQAGVVGWCDREPRTSLEPWMGHGCV